MLSYPAGLLLLMRPLKKALSAQNKCTIRHAKL